MEYSVSIRELVKRPFIRYDKSREWMNKMTDEEIKKYYEELKQQTNDGDLLNGAASILTKEIDRDILYSIIRNRTVHCVKSL
jgi:hypothetical protein